MAAIEVQLLGRFLVRRSGKEVPAASFGGRLMRVLIRLLVTRRGSFVSRGVLAEALWPERMPADPSTNLRVLVQRARAALGDPALIVTGPGGYTFAAGAGCEVDTEIFLARVQASQDRFAAGHASAALRDFRSVLDLWGEPLAEDAYQDWAQDVRGSLGRAYLQALETGAEAALAVRDPGQAVALAERAVSREPLRETAVVLLARALAASGDQVGALRAIGRRDRATPGPAGGPGCVRGVDLRGAGRGGPVGVEGPAGPGAGHMAGGGASGGGEVQPGGRGHGRFRSSPCGPSSRSGTNPGAGPGRPAGGAGS